MTPLFIPYSVFKSVITICNIPTYYTPDNYGNYAIYVQTTDIAFSTTAASSDATDFENSFKGASTQVGSFDEAAVRAITGQPNLVPATALTYFPGAGDDAVNGLGRGQVFQHSSTDLFPTDHVIEYQFNDWVMIHGGTISFMGAQQGDTMSYYLYAPATAVTSTPGSGNCNLAGPGNVLIVPAAGNGSNTVDLTAAKPVPNTAGTGFYDYAPANTGKGTISAHGSQNGNFDLYTVNVTLSNLIVSLPLVTSNNYTLEVPARQFPKKVFPQWVHHITIHNSGHAGLSVVWFLTAARMKTT